MDGWIIGVVAGLVAGVVTVVGNGLVIKKLRDQINALKGTIDIHFTENRSETTYGRHQHAHGTSASFDGEEGRHRRNIARQRPHA